MIYPTMFVGPSSGNGVTFIGPTDPVLTQYPYTEEDEWVIVDATIEAGVSTTVPRNGNLIRRFVLSYELVQKVDMDLIQTFWDLCQGQLLEFEFTDDEGGTWYHTRFDMDALEVTYNEPGSYTFTVKLLAMDNATPTGPSSEGSGDAGVAG